MLKALQEAVPEDVRGKLTTAVSGILQSQDARLKLKELLRVSRISGASPGLKSKMEETVREASNAEGLSQDNSSPDQTRKGDNVLDDSANDSPDFQTLPEGMESEKNQSESSKKATDIGQSQSISEENENSSSARKETNDSKKGDDSDGSVNGKGVVNSENHDGGLETGAKANSVGQEEKTGSAEEAKLEEHDDQAGKTSVSDIKEDHNAKADEKPLPDQVNISSPAAVEENTPPSSGISSEGQSIENEDIDNQKKENKTTEHVPDQLKPSSDSGPPSFSVSQALDALTGFDDSTQVAVNSVFGVIEDMISQLEEGSNNESGADIEKNASGSSMEEDNETDDQRQENIEAELGEGVDHDGSTESSHFERHKSGKDSQRTTPIGFVESQSAQRPIVLHKNDIKGLQERDPDEGKEARINNDELSARNCLNNSNRIKKVDGIPTYITSYTNGSYSDNHHRRNNLVSDIPTDPLDSDATTALLLEFIPEEGQWKFLEQSGLNGTPHDVGGEEKDHVGSPAKAGHRDEVIEPLYAILDTELYPVEQFNTEHVEIDDNTSTELIKFVRKIILDNLCIEVGRKLGSAELEAIDPNLARELEQVSSAVSVSVGNYVKCAPSSDVKYQNIDEILEEVGTLNGERIIRVMSDAVQGTTYLRRMLPLGVIIGSSLAALRNFFNVATVHDADVDETVNLVEHDSCNVEAVESSRIAPQQSVQNGRLEASVSDKEGKSKLNDNNNATVMVGAVTAAIGASAFLMQNQVLVKNSEFPISHVNCLYIKKSSTFLMHGLLHYMFCFFFWTQNCHLCLSNLTWVKPLLSLVHLGSCITIFFPIHISTNLSVCVSSFKDNIMFLIGTTQLLI